MGLDITAYGKTNLIEVVGDVEAWEEKYYFGSAKQTPTTYIYRNPGWPERMGSLTVGGVYSYEENYDFRAGSYMGYNWWRNELSLLALGVRDQAVWDHEDTFEDSPFFELICFSDCEGVIGPEASQRLAKAFAEHQKKADGHSDEYFREGYSHWRKAFELAAQNGFVSFH